MAHIISATYLRFDHMSPTAAGMAATLHVLAALALLWGTPIKNFEVPPDPIEVTMEEPTPPKAETPPQAPPPPAARAPAAQAPAPAPRAATSRLGAPPPDVKPTTESKPGVPLGVPPPEVPKAEAAKTETTKTETVKK